MDTAAAGTNRAAPAGATTTGAAAGAAQQAAQQQGKTAAANANTNAGGGRGGAGDPTQAPAARAAPTSTAPFLSKRSRPWPLLTPEQLADDTPSRRAGIPAKRERAFFRSLYSLVKEGGQALALAQQTTTTALLFGFRYFALRSFSRSDRFVVGAAALFLAAKARDELRPLDAVVIACLKMREAQGGGGGKKKGNANTNAANQQEGGGSVAASPMYTPTPTPGHGGGGASSSSTLPSPATRTAAAIAAASLGPSTLAAQLADKAYMSSLKEAVLTAERALLYALGFELDLELPHDALMASLALLRKSEDAGVAEFWGDPKHTQVALSFINDSFRTSLCLMHDWAHVGVGALVAVVDKLGGPPPVVTLGSGSGNTPGGGNNNNTSTSTTPTSSAGARRFFWELVPSCSDLTPELLADVVRIISGMYETAATTNAGATGAATGAAAGKKRKAAGGEEGEGGGDGEGGEGEEGNNKKVKTEQGATAAAAPALAAVVKREQQQQGQFGRTKRRRRRKRSKAGKSNAALLFRRLLFSN